MRRKFVNGFKMAEPNEVIITACTTANQISYDTFCLYGGLENPKLAKRQRANGSHVYTTYHMFNTINNGGN